MNKKIFFASLFFALLYSQSSQAADVFNGSELYNKHCKFCHGTDGRGAVPGAADFTRGESLFKTDPELTQSIRKGKNGMPAFVGILKDREILDIIAHIRTYQR